MKTYSRPPLISTTVSPESIIGSDGNMRLFANFIAITSSKTNAGEWPVARLKKEISEKDRPAIAAVLQRLRDNGFYPDGLDHTGKVIFRTVLKSESQEIMESGLMELDGLSTKELQQMARGGYLRRVKRDDKQEVSKEFVSLVDVA